MKIEKKVILASSFSVLMLVGLFGVHVFQDGGFEYLSAKEALIRYTMACFDSDKNSSGYGGFAPSVGGKNYRWFFITREALELLAMLDAVESVNKTAVLQFLNTSEVRIMYSSGGYYYTYYAYGMSDIYDALLSLNALDSLNLADALINMSRLHYMLVNQSTNYPMPLWANVFVANFLGWTDELNKKWYAENLYNTCMRFMMFNYGCQDSLGYGFGDFYDIYRNLLTLSMVGGVEAFTSDQSIITDFENFVETFLLLRWDSYNGGFADDIGGYLFTETSEPRFVVSSVKPTYTCLQLARKIGLNLPQILYGEEEWVNNAFARLISRSQTKYGFFKSSLPRYMLYNYAISVEPWDYEIEDNYYAVSLLNSTNQMQILDKGSFRWPPDAITLVENYEKGGYLVPLVAAIAIVPISLAVLITWLKKRKLPSSIIPR